MSACYTTKQAAQSDYILKSQLWSETALRNCLGLKVLYHENYHGSNEAQKKELINYLDDKTYYFLNITGHKTIISVSTIIENSVVWSTSII